MLFLYRNFSDYDNFDFLFLSEGLHIAVLLFRVPALLDLRQSRMSNVVFEQVIQQTVYGSVGILVVTRCTLLSFCRRLGRKHAFERATKHSHRQKRLQDSLRGQPAACLSNHVTSAVYILEVPHLSIQKAVSHKTYLTWMKNEGQKVAVKKEEEPKWMLTPVFSPQVLCRTIKKITRANGSWTFPICTLLSSSLVSFMVL